MVKVYRLRKRLSEDTEYYDKDEIEKYIDYLEEKGRLVRVGNLFLDAEALLRPFVCDTRLCMTKKGGRKGENQSCCVAYTPRLSTNERRRVDKILPALRERFPFLEKALDEADEYYYWDEGYDRLVNKSKEGLCVFLSPDEKEFGFHACAIHAYCRENGLSPYLYKPAACVMFPLFLLDVDDEDETVLLTAHSREVMTLGEDEDNFEEVGCCQPNDIASRPLYVEMRDTLQHMFGAEAWQRADRVLRKWKAARE